jgi:hypothetical protein
VSLSLFGSRLRRLIGLVTDATSGLLIYRNDEDTVFTGGGELEARLAWPSGAWLMGAVSVAGISGGDPTARTNSLPIMAVTKALVPLGKTASLAFELVYNAPRRQRDGEHTDPCAPRDDRRKRRAAARRATLAADDQQPARLALPRAGGERISPARHRAGRAAFRGLAGI